MPVWTSGCTTARDRRPSPWPTRAPRSSIRRPGTSQTLTEQAAALGTAVLAAPVSGNPKVVKSGKLTVVASGPADAYATALPYLANPALVPHVPTPPKTDRREQPYL